MSDPTAEPASAAPKDATPAPTAPTAAPKIQEPAPMAAQAQASVPQAPVAPDPPKASNPIPVMNMPRVAQLFNRMDRDSTNVVHVVNITNQDTLSGETYDQLQQISSVQLPITRAKFIRMWKTIILKRTQDVYESQYMVRPTEYIRLNRSIVLPATLADVVHALGSFFSTVTGRTHFIAPPARPAPPEEFWTVDSNIVRDFIATTQYMNPCFIMKEYPSQRETDARPIMLTYRLTQNARMRIKALTNEPRLSDAFIRMVNDDLFVAHGRFSAASCSLNMTPDLTPSTIRGRYIAGYVTRPRI